ncbi:NAD(P)/FAD-dependent oxidoreductase, partial [Oxalobacteraceae bacterium OM1]
GHAVGIPGPDILRRMQEQAAHYGVPRSTAVVERIEPQGGGFLVHTDAQSWRTRTIILATGVIDVAPQYPHVKQAVDSGCLRYCPICDGFEAIGKRVAVLGRGAGGAGEAAFVSHFAEEVMLCSTGDPVVLDDDQRNRLAQARVRIVSAPVRDLVQEGECGMRLVLEGGETVHVDVVYAALGTLVNSGLATVLGAQANESGELLVDAHQQTNVDGLYAVGDVVHGLNQIAVAMGHAAIAATAIHNRL